MLLKFTIFCNISFVLLEAKLINFYYQEKYKMFNKKHAKKKIWENISSADQKIIFYSLLLEFHDQTSFRLLAPTLIFPKALTMFKEKCENVIISQSQRKRKSLLFLHFYEYTKGK